MCVCVCVGTRYADESPNECTLGPRILCARTGIFIWCHFNFPAFSFYRRNENESNGKKGSIQRCSSSIRATATITRRGGRGRRRGREAIAHRCLPFLAWLLRRFCVAFGTLLTCHEIVVCCPFFFPRMRVCVCQLDTVQRVVQSPLQITCGSVKQKRWQLCDSVAPSLFTPGG